MSEFDRCAPWIEAALEGEKLTAEQVRQGIGEGAFHLFTHPEGVVVTEFVVSPRSRGLHAFVCGGTLEAMRELLPQVETWARAMGCDAIGATGRKGWVRFLAPHGYAGTNTVIKEL